MAKQEHSPERERLELERLRKQIVTDELTIEKSRYDVAQASYALRKAKREDSWAEAQDSEAKTLVFVGAIEEESVISASDKLRIMSRRFPGADLTIVFNSPGGMVIEGLALYDQIVELRKMGHHITTVARGQAASMGAILLQAGDLRLIGSNAHILIHEITSGSVGKVTEMEEQLEFTKKIQNRLVAILAERSTMSRREIRQAWQKTDWWLDARQAVKLGFADKVG